MQKSHVMSCEFFVASEDAPAPLNFVYESLDVVALFVADAVIVPWLLATASGRDDHPSLLGCEQVSQRVRVVAFVGNNSVKLKGGKQRLSLGYVIAFTSRQYEL